MIYKLTLINKIFLSKQRCINNVLLFTTTSKLLQKASIVNLLCVIKTEPRLILFHFTILKVLKIVTIYITKSSLASCSCMFQYWDSESCQFMNNIHFVNWGNNIKSTKISNSHIKYQYIEVTTKESWELLCDILKTWGAVNKGKNLNVCTARKHLHIKVQTRQRKNAVGSNRGAFTY